MKRELLGRAVVRLYPSATRTARGAELVGTLLDAGDASTRAFGVQLCSVIAAGLAARLRESMSRTNGQLVINTLAWAAIATVAAHLVSGLGLAIRSGGDVRFAGGTLLALGLPALVLALFTSRRTRTSGLVGITWIVFSVVQYYRPIIPFSRPVTPLLFWYALSAAGFAALALVPHRVASRGRWVWLASGLAYALLEMTSVEMTPIGSQAGVSSLAFLIVALCFLPFMPEFALGTALAQSALGVWFLAFSFASGRFTPYSIEVLACTALALTAVVVGRSQACRDSAERTPPG